jgi:hypothetical protein
VKLPGPTRQGVVGWETLRTAGPFLQGLLRCAGRGQTDGHQGALGVVNQREAFTPLEKALIQASLMGPVMSGLPVRQTAGSASADGHSPFLFSVY